MNKTLLGRYPLRSLSIIYVAWKTLLVLIVIASPGPGYDTSATLINLGTNSTALTPGNASLGKPLLNFVRWDSIFFTHIAEHGHVYESEWAFGAGLSTIISNISRIVFTDTLQHKLTNLVLSGICLSHLAHYAAVVLVFRLTQEVLIDASSSPEIPFVAALLHIISPAGMFLSAPYTEAPFAALNLLGYLMFFTALRRFKLDQAFVGAVLFMSAGFAFGLATTLRSNGILSGTLFAWESICVCLAVLNERAIAKHFLKLVSLVVGGVLVAAGMFVPQYLAYQEYCVNNIGSQRPWCQQTIPAIYPYVQSHYWGVGFLKYWLVSNIPLFIMATPTIAILVYSSINSLLTKGFVAPVSSTNSSRTFLFAQPSLRRIALPELVLAMMAFTSYHVQIITRISSGYPHWYMWLAAHVCQPDKGASVRVMISWMVLYATIQAGLYASFLPPA